MPRRRPGTLLPLEIEILEVALSMLHAGQPTFHGFGVAQTMRAARSGRSLTAHGTLYKALGRLEELGLLASDWEQADTVEGRPRRRMYRLTGSGVHAAEDARASMGQARPRAVATGSA
jgi:PadR family transcriptional regulator PadR